LVVFPTETFYGLGGDPWHSAAVERIFVIKERDLRKPLPLIAADAAAVLRAAANWPSVADLLARTFWLALLVLAHPPAPPVLHAHTGKIAVRVSSREHTSPPPSGTPRFHQRQSLRATVLPASRRAWRQIAHRWTGCSCWSTVGDTSTLVDVTVHPPQLVRAGAIGWERIEAALS
jgi:L-threonylcarbamoyladenylate synthase